METTKRSLSPLLNTILVFSSLFSIVLMSYSGHFSRFMSDDYCIVAVGNQYGGWGAMLYWYQNWEGSYSALFFRSLLAPLQELMPILMPAIMLWIASLSLMWIIHQLCTIFDIPYKRVISVTLAFIGIFLTVNSFHSMQSFYWYTAAVEYTFPLPLLTFLIGFIIYCVRRYPEIGIRKSAVVFCFVWNFLICGFAESHSAFQVTFFTLAGILVWIFIPRLYRRVTLFLLGASWLGSLVSLIVQISSPGLSQRFVTELGRTERARPSFMSLVHDTLTGTLQYSTDRYMLGGFVVLFLLALIFAFTVYHPAPSIKFNRERRISVVPLLVWLAIQLLYTPALWSHTSNSPQIMGSYSYAFFAVIVTNLVFIGAGILLLILRNRLTGWLNRQVTHWNDFHLLIAGLWLAVFLVTQIVRLDPEVVNFLVVSLVLLLVFIILQLAQPIADSIIRKLLILSLLIGLCAPFLFASIISASIFGVGGVIPRILPAIPYVIILIGMIWGALTGILLRIHAENQAIQLAHRTQKIAQWTAIGVILAVLWGAIFSQARLIPDLAQFAQDWQTQHELILTERQNGERDIHISPLRFDLAAMINASTLNHDPANRCAKRYYDVDSITVTTS